MRANTYASQSLNGLTTQKDRLYQPISSSLLTHSTLYCQQYEDYNESGTGVRSACKSTLMGLIIDVPVISGGWGKPQNLQNGRRYVGQATI